MNAAEFIALLLVLAIIAIPIYTLYQSTQEVNISTTTTTPEYTGGELAYFALSPNVIPRQKTIQLSNGTIVVIRDKDPFNFKLNHPTTASIPFTKFPKELPVYKAVTFNNSLDLASTLKPFKLKANNIAFSKETNEFIFDNSTVFFSYNKLNGKFALEFKKPIKSNPVMFVQQSGLLSWDFIILKTNQEVSLIRLFQGIPSTIGINVKLVNGSIIEISGWLFRKIYLLSDYPVLQPQGIYEHLDNRISGRVISKDWYINTLAFTEADINSLSLKYTLTLNNYIVPTYMFSGKYILNINGDPRTGELNGAILGILEKNS